MESAWRTTLRFHFDTRSTFNAKFDSCRDALPNSSVIIPSHRNAAFNTANADKFCTNNGAGSDLWANLANA
jgi:hypothetical protein